MQISYSNDQDRMDRFDQKLDVIMNRLLEVVEEINSVHDIASAAYDAVESLAAEMEQFRDGLGENVLEVETD